MKPFYLYTLLSILLLKAAIFSLIILYSGIGLGPDEAQYWTWSQQLDWGYYSKPPGIAWQIAFTTWLFGNTELGIRFSAVLISFFIPLAVFYLAKSCKFTSRTAFWSALVMAFTPLGLLSSFFATTDAGYLLFWTLACAVFIATQNTLLVGITIFCGALFKWPIYILWLFIIPFTIAWKGREALPKLFLGIFISLIGLLPSLFWNWNHQWATFRHVGTTMVGGAMEPGTNFSIFQGNFLGFLGAQIALVSPIIFILILIAVFWYLKERKWEDRPLLFCWTVFIATLLFFSLFSLFKKMQGNWSLMAYPTAFVGMSKVFLENKKKGSGWILGGLSLSIFLFALVLLYHPYLPFKSDPFKYNLGWERIEHILEKVNYNPQEQFLFSDKYQTTSILSFYSPNKERAYFLNLQNIRNNQFSYWPGMAEEQKGKNGIFFYIENTMNFEPSKLEEYQNLLIPYFEEVRFLGIFPLYSQKDRVVKNTALYEGIRYNGVVPKQTHKF